MLFSAFKFSVKIKLNGRPPKFQQVQSTVKMPSPRAVRYLNKTSAEARQYNARNYIDEAHTCGVCQEKQDNEYSTCCEACGLMTCEDCLNPVLICARCDEEESYESYTRPCMECGEEFTPSVDHADDGVCDECVSEKGKKQVLKQTLRLLLEQVLKESQSL
jgi:hypothetical protein